jgi:uncharacterized protein (TIGR02217 family)
MSDCVFPKLPGLTFEIKPVPTWSNIVQKSKNRARTVIMNDPYPQWTFELTYEFLRDSAPALPGSASNPENFSELEQIVGFYNARGGSFDSFLLDPVLLTGRPTDSTVTAAPVGTGDGITTTFYLHRNCGGFLDEVQSPTTVYISVNGVVQGSGWRQGAAGQIIFPVAPAAGAVITWDGSWQWRVCFAEDSLGLEQFMYELYELQSLKLEQVKL